MDDELFQKLAIKYTDLFQKAEISYFENGPGWYNILDTLFGLIYYDCGQARHRLQYAIDEKQFDKIDQYEAKLKEEIENLPIIVQVKEKFGSLRVYVNYSNEEIDNYIRFAESMSYRTCEKCGAPGERRNDGWIKTLCDNHYQAKESKDITITLKVPTFSPDLGDE